MVLLVDSGKGGMKAESVLAFLLAQLLNVDVDFSAMNTRMYRQSKRYKIAHDAQATQPQPCIALFRQKLL